MVSDPLNPHQLKKGPKFDLKDLQINNLPSIQSFLVPDTYQYLPTTGRTYNS